MKNTSKPYDDNQNEGNNDFHAIIIEKMAKIHSTITKIAPWDHTIVIARIVKIIYAYNIYLPLSKV